ncbi:MAG: hypothetical protein U0354_11795 [Candidatus Sericytochromatia bacterium]
MKTLDEIHTLEINENWEEAIKELEIRYKNYPNEKETILRLIFTYWYLIIEDGIIKHNLSLDDLRYKFKLLYEETKEKFKLDAEYQWIVGFLIRLYEVDQGDLYNIGNIAKFSIGKQMILEAKKINVKNPMENFNNRGNLGIYFENMSYE